MRQRRRLQHINHSMDRSIDFSLDKTIDPARGHFSRPSKRSQPKTGRLPWCTVEQPRRAPVVDVRSLLSQIVSCPYKILIRTTFIASFSAAESKVYGRCPVTCARQAAKVHRERKTKGKLAFQPEYRKRNKFFRIKHYSHRFIRVTLL